MKRIRKTLKHDEMMEKMIQSAIALTSPDGTMTEFNNGIVYGMKTMMEMFYKEESEDECVGLNISRIVSNAVNEHFSNRRK